MKTILLLGANGQLGSDIGKVFAANGGVAIKPVTRRDIDVENTDRIVPFLEQAADGCDWIINCTSYHRTDECEDFAAKAFSINAVAVREMARYCQASGKVFVHFSTDYVFDGLQDAPYTETDLARPLNVYGVSKLAGERFVELIHDRHYIFRVASLFGVAGASGKGGNFVETMVRLAKAGNSLKVVADQIMSPTHTLDIARMVYALARNDGAEFGIYHCAGGGQCSWYEFAAAIFAQIGLNADLSPTTAREYRAKALRPAYSVLDSRKLADFYKMPDWKKSLAEYLELKGYK
jgi:dTDP-4-dehydrorhamnose reductase